MFAIIVHFNIQKLKNKHTFIQTEKAKSSHFDRMRGDKKQIFPTSESFGIGAILTKHVCHFKKGMTKLMMYIAKINNLTVSIPIPIIELSALDFH